MHVNFPTDPRTGKHQLAGIIIEDFPFLADRPLHEQTGSTLHPLCGAGEIRQSALFILHKIRQRVVHNLAAFGE